MAIFFLYKIARDDFVYWIPVSSLTGTILVSVFCRAVNKTIVNFTGIVQYRHTNEMGGAYWTANMALGGLSSFGSVGLYYSVTDTADVVMSPATGWTIISLLTGAWIVTFRLFLLKTKAKYRKSFFCWETGKEDVLKGFQNSLDDAKKAHILTRNSHVWSSIRNEVKKWIEENWWGWEEEQPEFFDGLFKKRVPLDMLPEEKREELKEESVKIRRGESCVRALAERSEASGDKRASINPTRALRVYETRAANSLASRSFTLTNFVPLPSNLARRYAIVQVVY